MMVLIKVKPNPPLPQPTVVYSCLRCPLHPHTLGHTDTYTQHHSLGLYPISPNSHPLPWPFLYSGSCHTMVLEEVVYLVHYWGNAELWCVDIQYLGSNVHPSCLKEHLPLTNVLVRLPTISKTELAFIDCIRAQDL